MFQPEAKYEFIRRYCPPAQGWRVFVDIDASEEGRTGGERRTEEARQRQHQMQEQGAAAITNLTALGAQVRGNRAGWFREHGLPAVAGDRDIVAFHGARRRLLVVEVEAESSGQPEQKVYKAAGQAVSAASAEGPEGWEVSFVIAVHGEAMVERLRNMNALEKLGISALALARNPVDDEWVFGAALAGMDKMDAGGGG